MPDSEVTIRVEGIDALIRKLRRLGPKVYKPAIAEGGAHLKNAIAEYPPRRLGMKQPPKTMRQRIFLVNAIEEGVIDFPYRRGQSPGSAALGRRWTVESRDNGLTAVVGNNAPYAKFVQGADDQNALHAEVGWKTDRQVVTEEADAVREILARHVRNAIRRSD